MKRLWLGAAIGLAGGLAMMAQTSAAAAAAPPRAAHAGQPAVPPTNRPQTTAERKAFSPNDKSAEAVVNAFNQRAFIDHDPVGAMKRYLSDDFIERYPDLAGPGPGTDKERTIRFFESRGWKAGQGLTDTIYQVIATKDRAVVFHKVTRGPKDLGTAYADIFRVENGLIVEHWAVGQPISPKISPMHSMF